MLIAQITDLHLGFDPDNPAEFNRKRLDQVIRAFNDMTRKPDILFATGDLVDRGDVASYRRLRSALGAVPCPVWLAAGNHDVRENLATIFPEMPFADGFLQYVVESAALRFIILDTMEEGRHGGAYCETRAAWLRARLDEEPDKPTVIVLHHPPIETGIDWMTTVPSEPWVVRLEAALAGHDQIVGMICGHIHRSIVTSWAGRQLAICPSTAPQVALDLTPLDPATPDGRPMIVADPPAYALHYWNGQALVSHFDTTDEHVVLARFDESMQPLVRSLIDEHPPVCRP